MAWDVDENARPYDPRNPPAGPFWVRLDAGLKWAGLLLAVALLYGLVYGVPAFLLFG